jgi:hypothetical protein
MDVTGAACQHALAVEYTKLLALAGVPEQIEKPCN